MTEFSFKPLLPNEPRVANQAREQGLTDQYLTPVLTQLELFFLALRERLDAELQPRQPKKQGKPYPLGQCLEISTAARAYLRCGDPSGLSGDALAGHAALAAFLRAGGTLRLVWGDLRGQFFQNAFQIGTLYVDVSNDTVVPTKPKVEILPFARSQLTPVRDYLHFKLIAERYWQDQVLPNHVLPELAPWFPLIHINPQGRVRLSDESAYMLALTRTAFFRPSEAVLAAAPIPAALFEAIAAALRGSRLKVALDPEQGRVQALAHCQRARARRWYESSKQSDRSLYALFEAKRYLSTMIIQTALSAAPSPVPLSAARHGGKRWLRDGSFHFAARDALAPMLAYEVPQAGMALAVGFVESGGAFMPAAVQGLEAGRNLLVDSAGRWLAGYIPLTYRVHPFSLSGAGGPDAHVQVDEHSGQLADGPEGEPLFDRAGQPAAALAEALRLLAERRRQTAASATICATLQRHGLIQRWPITLQRDGREQRIAGLFRIDEAALNALAADTLAELRDCGALALAYCQLLSMQNLARLGSLM